VHNWPKNKQLYAIMTIRKPSKLRCRAKRAECLIYAAARSYFFWTAAKSTYMFCVIFIAAWSIVMRGLIESHAHTCGIGIDTRGSALNPFIGRAAVHGIARLTPSRHPHLRHVELPYIILLEIILAILNCIKICSLKSNNISLRTII